MAQIWQTVRVFISSTFGDMHTERDHLVRVVFPELKERCRQRHIRLIGVDLRWGVTEKQAQPAPDSIVAFAGDRSLGTSAKT
jgi:hypothetical protein